MLRLFAQAADGTLQVGMASYVLFSPQTQADAWAITAVLAITLLPYTIVGPFVSPLLDKWSRRDVALYSDIVRIVLTLVIAGIIFSGWTSGVGSVVLMAALLVAMSLNRFMLAGLSAGLEHTVTDKEYLSASSVIPTVGPLGVVIGGVIGFAVRLSLGRVMEANQADAIVFLFAAVLFCAAAITASRFGRHDLGPVPGTATTSMRQVASGLADAGRHLRHRSAALLGLLTMTATRFLFCLLSVAVILAARNLWHPVDEPDAAIADLGVWGLFTGAGFLLATVVVPAVVSRIGLRNGMIAFLVMGGAAQALTTFAPYQWPLFIASFFVGLTAQTVKICVDGIVHAHVDDQFKGRAFTFYDGGFNGAYVLAALVATFALPADGLSTATFAAMALGYAFLAGIVWWSSERLGAEDFDRGAEDLIVERKQS